LADEIEAGVDVAGFRQRLEHIEAVKGAEILGSVLFQNGGDFGGLAQAGEGEQRGGGFAAAGFRAVLAE